MAIASRRSGAPVAAIQKRRGSCCRDDVSHGHRANQVPRLLLHRGHSQFSAVDSRLDQVNRMAQRRSHHESPAGVLDSAAGKSGPQPPAPSRPDHSRESRLLFTIEAAARMVDRFSTFFSWSIHIKSLRLYIDRTSSSGLFDSKYLGHPFPWAPSRASASESLNPASALPCPSKLTVPVAVCGNFGLILAVICSRSATEKPLHLSWCFLATASAVFLRASNFCLCSNCFRVKPCSARSRCRLATSYE